MIVERDDAKSWTFTQFMGMAHFLHHEVEGDVSCATGHLLALSTKLPEAPKELCARFSLMALMAEQFCPTLRLTENAQMLLISAAGCVDDIITMMVDCEELQGKLDADRPVTAVDILTGLYPYGFYNEKSSSQRADEIIGERFQSEEVDVLSKFIEALGEGEEK